MRLTYHPRPALDRPRRIPSEPSRPATPGRATLTAAPHANSAPMSAHYSPIRRRAARPPRRPLWILTAAVLALVLTAVPAHADTVVVALAAGVTDVLNNVRNWIMGILAGLATVFLSIGGVRYVMGSGDPGEIEKAKTAFKSAGWGYGLAALAPLIVEILKGIVGA
ncbi:hypothetical protein EV192_11451 [Actinocrispum wychmicini]|uniref:TrbC/VIRB2 family protein n=2 Tax=Actinocrispum wychmicini TaxID=1213861 RepID=A0A4R2J2Z5_9PSEU|nr:hypothetical protein EV192_11451 [Actinocrispum wychmicini]